MVPGIPLAAFQREYRVASRRRTVAVDADGLCYRGQRVEAPQRGVGSGGISPFVRREEAVSNQTLRAVLRSFVPFATAGLLAGCGVASGPVTSLEPRSEFVHASPTDAPKAFFGAIGPAERACFAAKVGDDRLNDVLETGVAAGEEMDLWECLDSDTLTGVLTGSVEARTGNLSDGTRACMHSTAGIDAQAADFFFHSRAPETEAEVTPWTQAFLMLFCLDPSERQAFDAARENQGLDVPTVDQVECMAMHSGSVDFAVIADMSGPEPAWGRGPVPTPMVPRITDTLSAALNCDLSTGLGLSDEETRRFRCIRDHFRASGLLGEAFEDCRD